MQNGQWKAKILSHQWPEGSREVFISLEGSSLVCVLDAERWVFEAHECHLQRSGEKNRLLLIQSQRYGDVSLVCGDPELQRVLLTRSEWGKHPDFRKEIRQDRAFSLVIPGLVLTFVGFLWFLWWLKDPLISMAVKQIPISWEEKISELSMEQMRLSKTFVKDSLILREVEGLAQPLIEVAKAQDTRDYQYRIAVLEDPTPNAFAMPGGQIVVHTGLLRLMKSPTQLQGVLAHEIAHVEAQHGMQSMVFRAGLWTGIGLLTGDAQSLAGAATVFAGELSGLKFSRDFEREADGMAFEFLEQARIEPSGLESFFAQLDSMEQNPLHGVMQELDFLSTHPNHQERMAELREKLLEKKQRHPQEVSYRDDREAWKRLKQRLER
jgi:Zn-dependent protease with chaperone function